MGRRGLQAGPRAGTRIRGRQAAAPGRRLCESALSGSLEPACPLELRRRALLVGRSLRSVVAALAALLIVPAAVVAKPDVARYILPPGNYGGARFTDESTDQLPLYDALTPLRDNIKMSDLNRLYLPENFKPVG